MARGVLWVALMLVLPMPLWVEEQLHLLPVAWLVQQLVHGLLGQAAMSFSLFEIVQGIASTCVLAMLAWAYGLVSQDWEDKVRGSVMSLFMFSLLIIFSSVPAYWLDGNDLTFLAVYQR
jgi:hypothetical protein